MLNAEGEVFMTGELRETGKETFYVVNTSSIIEFLSSINSPLSVFVVFRSSFSLVQIKLN
jgi:hypothetical protein